MYIDVKGLEKNYGIRIPVQEYVDYYIETLLKSKEKESLKRDIVLFNEFQSGIEDFKSFKYNLIQNAVSYLKGVISEKINSWEAPEKIVLETNEFKPEHNKYYISFDVSQANWSVTKHFLNLDLPSWEIYSREVLGFPESLSYSKPLRQAILGQVVNPKRFDYMQKYLTMKHLAEMKKIEKYAKVVCVNNEEIILEIINKEVVEHIKDVDLKWIIPVKTTIFKTVIYNNYGDSVVVKEYLNDDYILKYKSLYGVNGHRFYIHFKTLILGESLDEKDTLFKIDNKIFSWCGEDLKDYREYNYIKKWIKPLIWEDKSALLSDNVLYRVLDITLDSVTIYDVLCHEEVVLKCDKYRYREVVSEYHYKKIDKYFE